MLTPCPECGTLHHEPTEYAYSPNPLDRLCVKCWNALQEREDRRVTEEIKRLYTDLGGEG